MSSVPGETPLSNPPLLSRLVDGAVFISAASKA